MIRIKNLDTKLHGEKLTSYLSKRGISYTIINSFNDVFDLEIDNTSTDRIKLTYNYEMISIYVMSMPADGYDIMRNEYTTTEVL